MGAPGHGADPEDLDQARRAGAAGARSVTRRLDLIGIAGERAMDLLVSSVMRGKRIRDVPNWAWVVGRNPASNLVRRSPMRRLENMAQDAEQSSSERPSAEQGFLVQAAAVLQDPGIRFTSRQRDVLGQLNPSVSLKGNARHVSMSPFSLRRMLRCIARRIRRRGESR